MPETDDPPLTFYGLAVALAIGLLIGLEREWSDRWRKSAQRVAGLRTFGLPGLQAGLPLLAAAAAGVVVARLL